jgi:hypothetical protein
MLSVVAIGRHGDVVVELERKAAHGNKLFLRVKSYAGLCETSINTIPLGGDPAPAAAWTVNISLQSLVRLTPIPSAADPVGMVEFALFHRRLLITHPECDGRVIRAFIAVR